MPTPAVVQRHRWAGPRATQNNLDFALSGSGQLTLTGTNSYSGNDDRQRRHARRRVAVGLRRQLGPLGLHRGQGRLAGNNITIGSLAGSGTVENAMPAPAQFTVGAEQYQHHFHGRRARRKRWRSVFAEHGRPRHADPHRQHSYSGGTILNGGMLIAANGSLGSATGTNSLTLNGGTLAAGAAGGSIAGLVQAGSTPHTIAPGANLSAGQYGTLNLNGGLTTNNNTTLAFNLGSPVSGGTYSGDLIMIGSGGVLTVGASTAINFATPGATGDYRLLGGNIGSPTLGNFHLPTARRRHLFAEHVGRLRLSRSGRQLHHLLQRHVHLDLHRQRQLGHAG